MDIILSAKGISKTYTAGQVKINALNRCDIEVRKGEFTAIVGKSGSGKSTLLRIQNWQNSDARILGSYIRIIS